MKIYVEGIKSISDGQYIALGDKLTFFVGPNSSGKSSAIFAINHILLSQSSIAKSKEIPNYIMKDIHRNQSGDRLAELQSVGVFDDGVEVRYSRGLEYSSHSKLISGDRNICEIVHKDEFWMSNNGINREVDGVGSILYIMRENPVLLEYMIGNSWFFLSYLNNNKEDQLRDYYNSFLININKISDKRLDDLCLWYSNLIDTLLRDGNPNFHTELDWLSEGWVSWSKIRLIGEVRRISKGRERQSLLNQIEKYDAIIKKIVAKIKHDVDFPKIFGGIRSVSPQRVVPSGDDLCSDIMLGGGIFYRGFRALMLSEILKTWRGLVFDSVFDRERICDGVLDDVNRILSDNLFYDRGYQIKVQSHLMVNSDQWENYDTSLGVLMFKCKIILLDQHGRELGFDDVGSGIGYVLPILIECFIKDDSNLVLQQPELHLHPAMQAQLCDVLIEAAAHKRIIAETHSEHMILRALKRVRQTSKGTLKDPSLALKPEDIAVNYFEPLPDGSTKVHIMRVSDDGDFIDRWPNGFFSERDQELFDE